MKERYLVDLDLREDVEFIVDTVKGIDLDMVEVSDLLNDQIKGCLDRENALIKENQQLKQSQNSKAIEILKNIIKFIENKHRNYYPAPFEIKSFIQNQISELGGKYEK